MQSGAINGKYLRLASRGRVQMQSGAINGKYLRLEVAFRCNQAQSTAST